MITRIAWRIRPRRAAAALVVSLGLVVAAQLQAWADPGDLDTSFGDMGRVRTDFAGHFDIARGVLVQPNGRIVVVGSALTGATSDTADFAVARYLGDGTPDPAFSGDGRVRTDVGGLDDSADAVAHQPDGKIVAVGSSVLASGESRFAVARYRAGGALDTTFSGDGKVRTAFPGFDTAGATDVAVQADGRIVVVGGATVGLHLRASRGGPGVQSDVAVARYKPNGSLDPMFGGGDGRVTTDFSGNSDLPSAVTVLPSGKILVAGLSQTLAGEQRVIVVKYRSNGTRDGAFDGDGRVAVNMSPGGSEHAVGISVRPDGTILVGASVEDGVSGSSGSDLGLLLLNADGSIHQSFGGGDGMAFADFGGEENPDEMVRQPDGKAVFVASRPPVSGGDPQAIWVFRLQKSGAKDSGFGTGGRSVVEFADGVGGFGVALDGSGRIVAVGRVGIGDNGDFAVVRLRG